MVPVVKSLPTNAGDARDTGSIPELGGSPGGGNGNLLPCPCLENPMDRGAWWATVHWVTKTQTRLSTAQHSMLVQRGEHGTLVSFVCIKQMGEIQIIFY